VIVDFHSHTNQSDGTLTPQELADFMGERRVEMFSISDHDTLAAYGTFDPPAGSHVIAGVEINTTYRGNEVHVLGYGMAVDAPALVSMIEKNRDARFLRARRMVEQLQRGGYGITFDQVLAQAPDAKALGRPHVAKALISAGMAPDIDWAFRNLLRSGMPGYVPSLHITPHEAIQRIAEAGGVPVLAHPGRLKDRSLIDELAPRGLQGLEIFYPLHDAEDVRIFSELARKHGLAATAGMDFHDIRYHARGVGIDVDRALLTPFLRLCGL
jgi:predicted metal-dependent phosphoesterase TrpH